jgi:MFS transporter, DHA1 family, tetracycline resistance protein
LIGAAFGLMAGPALGGLLNLHSLGAPAFAASALALANTAFGYLILPESHPPRLRRRIPLLRLNPVSQLGVVLRMGDIRPLLLVVLLLNLAFTGFLNYKPARG